MKRRDFVTLFGGAAAWPLSARAQQSTRVATVGFLDATSRSTQGQIASEFVQRLRELGWREGQNLVVEVRWAEGRPDRYAEIAAEFVRLKVDVIVTTAITPTRPNAPPRARVRRVILLIVVSRAGQIYGPSL